LNKGVRLTGPEETDREARRGVLWWVLCGLGTLVLVYPVLSFMSFRKKRQRPVTFHPDEQLAQVTFKEGVFLVREEAGYYALSARCTHLGCILNYDEPSKRFRCPCHRSVFALSGKWLSGPAEKDLQRLPLSVKGNKDMVAILNL